MSDQPAGGARGGGLKWSLWGVGLAGVAAVIYIIAQASSQPEGPSAPGPATPKFDYSAKSTPAPDFSFLDPDGKPVRLADFRGQVVVLNLWATWCAPCVIEMPTLARVAQAYAGQPIAVVAISVDSVSDTAKAKAFLAKNAPLKFYQDPSARFPFELNPPAPGMPTTVIYGRDGLERARLSGPSDWSGPGAKAVIDAALAGG